MNLGLKRSLRLGCRSAGRDPVPPSREGNHLQALLLKPMGDLGEIGVACAEALPVFLRRQPMMLIGRAWSLLVSQKFFEFALLAGRWGQRQRDVGDRQRRRHSALVVGGEGLWM